MYSIYYTKESESNLLEIFLYISDDNWFYAAKVITHIKSTIDILKLFPLSGKLIKSEYRLIVESKYKYKIVYKINKNIVQILSIFKYQNIYE